MKQLGASLFQTLKEKNYDKKKKLWIIQDDSHIRAVENFKKKDLQN